jgi:hypothetical protein
LRLNAERKGYEMCSRLCKKVEQEVDTVFSLGLIIRPLPDGTAPVLKVLDELGIAQPVRGKVNVGLGRPIAEA